MPTLKTANPQISVRLYKNISRETVDGQIAVSARYRGKSEFIDLTPFLGDGASVRTSKSVREPAGGFVVTFADKARSSSGMLESVYGLVEPMDVVEIRMWGGAGARVSGEFPIVMRGFVSEITRGQAMSESGTPVRTVAIVGQDYGKLWQTYQVIYLAAYTEGTPLLTSFQLFELFGVGAVSGMPAGEFVRTMIEKVINQHLAGLMPENGKMPSKMLTGDSIAVKHGVVNNSYQNAQGSIYDILKFHGDVGVWNELYVEDREDGVHVVYRPIPALKLSGSGATGRETIQDDAPTPVFVPVPEASVKSYTPSRGDSQVVNFFWVNNASFDLIDDMQRKLSSIPANDSSVSLKEYPNTAVRYYGIRPMFASTQQWDEALPVPGSGQNKSEHEKRTPKLEAWLDRRRRLMAELNKDQVVLERGSAVVKGGLMRPGSSDSDLMKAGDYALFQFGRLEWAAYVVQIDHEWVPYQGYTQTLYFERGEGFVTRARESASPYLVEMSTGRI